MKLVRVALACVLLASLATAQRASRAPGLPPVEHAFDAAVVVLGPLDPAMERLVDLDANGTPEVLGIRVEAWNEPSRINLSTLSPDGTPVPFWEGEFFTLGSLPEVVSQVGDVDGDGFEDFAVMADERLWIWTTNGMGAPTALAPVDVPVEAYIDVLDFTLGDFNGDGRMDPAVLDEEELHVWLSAPDGTPQGPPQSIPFDLLITNLGGNFLLAADFLADGTDELVVLDGRDLSFFDFVGGVPTPHSVLRADPSYIANGMNWGDVDGDGDSDLVVWDDRGAGTGRHRTLEQTTPGNYVWSTAAFVGGGPATDLLDVDGDGDLDGVCCSGGGGDDPPPRPNDVRSDFQVAINLGPGVFRKNFKIPGLGARRLAGVTDVNGDGLRDLVAGRAVYFARRPIDRSPTSTYGEGYDYGLGNYDHDGDGDIDSEIDLGGNILENNGNLTRTPTQPTLLGEPSGYNHYSFPGDWDGDGDLDFIATRYDNGQGSQHLVRNLGGGTYAWGPLASPESFMIPSLNNQHAFDADGDGDRDLITSQNGSGGGLAYIYWNDGTGYFPTVATGIGLEVGGFADLDGDGLEDVLVADQQIGWLRNRGGGSFSPPLWFPQATAETSSALAVTVVDMEGDGDLDVWSTRGRDTIVFLENDGRGVFTAHLDRIPGPDPDLHSSWVEFKLSVLDVNLDGALDVIRFPGRGSRNSGLIYLAQAPGGPYVETDELVLAAWEPHDADADGDLDLVGRSVHENLTRRPPGHARYRQYGAGTPGHTGLVPKLGLHGPIQADVGPPLTITNGCGAGVGILACSPSAGYVVGAPYPGVTSYLNLEAGNVLCKSFQLSGLPGEAGTGSFEIPAAHGLNLAGRRFHLQAFLVDPGAPEGYSATNAIQIVFGEQLD